ncbi:MAG: C39 family peptidase [Candidatus Dormibacterales bacterium]
MSGRALAAVVAACATALGVLVYRVQFAPSATATPPRTGVVIVVPQTPAATASNASSAPSPTPKPLPASVRIQVPYTPQAPHDDWATHEDNCEAAAIVMYASYLHGDRRSTIPPDEADSLMTPVLRYERAWLANPHPDLTLEEIGEVANHFYGFRYEVGPAGYAAVRRQLAEGHPVVIPVMTHGAPGGAKLTPYYGAVSVYHVVLLVGYTSDGLLIANDAGFMQGQYWRYTWATLVSAMAAQEPRMHQGQVMLTLSAA